MACPQVGLFLRSRSRKHGFEDMEFPTAAGFPTAGQIDMVAEVLEYALVDFHHA